MAALTKGERAARQADGRAQQLGPAGLPVMRHARDYVHAVNPENNAEVVFKPGERLPAWATEAESDDG